LLTIVNYHQVFRSSLVAQYITIENNWQRAVFHCPACGKPVFTERGEPTNKPCSHLLFSWINEIGEFYNAAAEIGDFLKDNEKSDMRLTPWDEEFLVNLPETAVLFGFELHGMACGPVCTTVVHAIKFPSAEDE
jgi:hypothetical protein